MFALGDVNQLVGQVNAFPIQCQSSASGLRPAKRPIAIAGTKSAPVARKRASASGKVKIPGFVICSLAFSIPRAGFFKLYSIRTANPNKNAEHPFVTIAGGTRNVQRPDPAIEFRVVIS